jgi:glycine/D-amino acid oxidase-like deaminating enzyme
MINAGEGADAGDGAGDGDGDGRRYREVSLWLDRYAGSLAPRPSLDGDADVDVAIVGAGFTGLWTAYYLAGADPRLRICVVEAEIAGFGASGRNGGWCSALFPASWSRIERDHGEDAARAMRRAMVGSVAEVGAIAAAERIDCGFVRGGTLGFARSTAQLARARAAVVEARRLGGELDLLPAARVRERAGVPSALAATFTPHCARIDPGALVRGLARAVERRGVRIVERTPATDLAPHRVVTPLGTVRAEIVVRATEAFTVGLPGHRRDLAPVYSLIVATEPLDERRLAAVGLDAGETFTDLGHLLCYGQRTADGRIVFGGRGAPYHFGSSTAPANDRDESVFARLRNGLVRMFPALDGVAFTHSWGGAVAAPRDWHASVGLDRSSGLAWAGGYVGDGVSTTNLAGRTLADLIERRDSSLVRLPWVGHRSRRWEPEPLRYLGVNAGLTLMRLADARESRTGRPSRTAALFGRLLGD